VTNDDGITAEGLLTLTASLGVAGLDAIVVAPASNQSGVSRMATYSRPVPVENVGEHAGIPLFACHGSPVDCVRAGLMSSLAPNADLVISGINHGANLGDDTLISGTVGAGIEAALLGVPGLAVSQQSYVGHFHILDALDQDSVVHQESGRLAALFAKVMLETGSPERGVLNVNVPAKVGAAKLMITRLGRRYYQHGSLSPKSQGGVEGYLTYGDVDSPPPPFEDDPACDFGAIKRGQVSVTPLSYSWQDTDTRDEIQGWAKTICRKVVALSNSEVPGSAG
jgi:5'-nucleotidase